MTHPFFFISKDNINALPMKSPTSAGYLTLVEILFLEIESSFLATFDRLKVGIETISKRATLRNL